MHPGVYSPSWTALPSGSMEGGISHPRFYTLWHAKVNQSIGTYKLGWEYSTCFSPAKIVKGDSCPGADGVLRRGECSLWRCSSLQRAQRQPGACTLCCRRKPIEIPRNSLSREDDRRGGERLRFLNLLTVFCHKNVQWGLKGVQVPACTSLAQEDWQEMLQVVTTEGVAVSRDPQLCEVGFHLL